MVRIRSSVVAVGLAISMALPVAGSTSAPERTRPAVLEGSSIAWCGDVRLATADPALYRDSPVYVYKSPGIGKIRRWAKTKPGFEEIWPDRDNFGWITVAFTEGVEERQAELEREFPGVGAVAVKVDYTRRELRRLQARVGDVVFPRIGSAGTGSNVASGTVSVGVGELTQEVVDLLESEFAGQPLCVDGPDPSELPQPGPQTMEGDGWRMVGRYQSGPPWYRTGIAFDEASMESLWAEAAMPDEIPTLDFENEVALWFAVPHGSSCSNLRLDDVVIDVERSLVYPLVVNPDNPRFCTSDLAGAYQYVAAIKRDRLPRAPFIIQLDQWDPSSEASEERTVVEADLRQTGGVAEPGEVHADRSGREPPPERSGTFLEPRQEQRYAFETSCGIGSLGQINGIHWVSEEADLPAAWQDAVGDDGEIVVRVRLVGEPDSHVTATANDYSVRYEPIRDTPPPCDG